MSTPLSGTHFGLSAGDYHATIASVGASLRTLEFHGRDLVVPFDADEVRPAFRGATLAPWPNRVVDGRYAFAGDVVVGASTGIPLADDSPAFRAPFEARGMDVARVFYCGESVLLPAYRGHGLGHGFFDQREAHARALGRFDWTAFCAVDRDPDDPRLPAGYRPNDAFWHGRGYLRQPGMAMRLRCQVAAQRCHHAAHHLRRIAFMGPLQRPALRRRLQLEVAWPPKEQARPRVLRHQLEGIGRARRRVGGDAVDAGPRCAIMFDVDMQGAACPARLRGIGAVLEALPLQLHRRKPQRRRAPDESPASDRHAHVAVIGERS